MHKFGRDTFYSKTFNLMDVCSTVNKKHSTLWDYSSKKYYKNRVGALSNTKNCMERDEHVTYGLHDINSTLLAEFTKVLDFKNQPFFYDYSAGDM